MEVETLLSIIAILVALILIVEVIRAFSEGGALLAMRGILEFLEARAEEDTKRREKEHNDISELIEAEQIDDALSLIHIRQQDRPNDARLYWYKGRALFLMGNKPDSQTAFLRSLELEPAYRESVKPYLDEE